MDSAPGDTSIASELNDPVYFATQCALDAIQLLGGNGYINDYPTGRLLRDAKLCEIGAGTSEIRRMLIGRELFDKSA
jgi:isovaleryl-CoA dehydrogenase